jgi:hypothetical protein
MKPALVVGALALVILVTFSIGAALTKHATPTRPLKTGPTRVPGSSLLAVPASGALRPIETGGEPPGNVLDDITLPKGSVFSRAANPGLGATYDEEASFSVDASQGAVLGFYQAELAHFGWHTVTSGAAEHQPGRQIVGEIAGDDGFYWELGVVVSPSTFADGGKTDVTRFTLRVLQVQDQE